MTRLAVTWHASQGSGQLLVAAHPQTSLRELFGPNGPLFVNGRPVPAEATLAAAGVRDGAVVGSVPVRPPVPVAPPGCLALLVASGAAAARAARSRPTAPWAVRPRWNLETTRCPAVTCGYGPRAAG